MGAPKYACAILIVLCSSQLSLGYPSYLIATDPRNNEVYLPPLRWAADLVRTYFWDFGAMLPQYANPSSTIVPNQNNLVSQGWNKAQGLVSSTGHALSSTGQGVLSMMPSFGYGTPQNGYFDQNQMLAIKQYIDQHAKTLSSNQQTPMDPLHLQQASSAPQSIPSTPGTAPPIAPSVAATPITSSTPAGTTQATPSASVAPTTTSPTVPSLPQPSPTAAPARVVPVA